MKSVFEKLVQSPDEGFVFKAVHGQACSCPWHFHPEYELILSLDGAGYRIVGDNFATLSPGDLVLLGANLPHTYKYVDDFPHSEDPPSRPDCLLIQFDSHVWSNLLDLPAFVSIRQLFRQAALGLVVQGEDRIAIEGWMRQMVQEQGVRRIILFFEILDTLARSDACKPISSLAFQATFDSQTEERINRVCHYISTNIDRPITIVEVAKLVHLSEGAFSRFFRAHLGKTFPTLLNELRVGRACQYLAETDMPVMQVAMACGYSNLSNFNRQFLKLKNMTPSHFRKQF